MSNAFEQATGDLNNIQSINDGGVLGGFRNKLINYDFDIWQRGTSQTSSGYGSVDRWMCQHGGGSTKTVSRQVHTVGQTDVPGSPKYFKRTVVTSGGVAASYALDFQKVEDLNTTAGQTVTLTFWAKADAAKNIAIEFAQNFGTGGSPSAFLTGPIQTVALTTAWQKFSFTVAIPSISGKVLGTDDNHNLYVAFWFDGGSDYNARTNSLGAQSGTFDISRTSLVSGDATKETDPTSPRHIQQEIALCQRYYEKSYDLGVAPGAVANGGAVWLFGTGDVSGRLGPSIFYKQQKRAVATISFYRRDTGAVGEWYYFRATGDNGGVVMSDGGINGTSGFLAYSNGILSGYQAGHVNGHWTADAEL